MVVISIRPAPTTRGLWFVVRRFKPSGQKLASLPGPADKPAFESLMGGALKVYKYRGVAQN